MNLSGLGVAMITPLTLSGKVDYKAIPKIVNHIVEGGAKYLVLMGTTSESPTLLPEEREKLINVITKENNGRLPMVLGIGGNDTYGVVKKITATNLDAFEAILSVSPYYNKPSQEGIYHHFKHISLASPKPIIVYNVPSRTSSDIEVETFIRIANDCTNVIGIKEACGDFNKIQQLIKNSPGHIQIVSGDDTLTLPMLFAGAVGCISVLGNAMPNEISRMMAFVKQQDLKKAYDLQYQLLDMMALIFEEGNPTGIKALMEFLGLSTKTVRLPLMNASTILCDKIEQKLHQSVL